MKRIIPILTICLLLVASSAWGANCGGGTPCACGDTITSSYTLTENLSCTNAGNALTIGANDITLDLGGYTIDGDDINTVIGVFAFNRTGVIIRNGTITDFTQSGTEVENSSGDISNLACNSTGNQGFQNVGTSNFTYNNISAEDNTDDGFSMHDSSIAVVSTATFSENLQGINTIGTSQLTGTDITIITKDAADGYALYFVGTTSVTLNGVVITGTTPTTIVKQSGGTVSIANLSVNAVSDDLLWIYGGSFALNDYSLSGTYSNSILNCDSGTPTILLERGTINAINTSDHVLDMTSGTLTLYSSVIIYIASGKFCVACRTGVTCNVFNSIFMDEATKDGKGIYWVGTADIKNNIFKDLAVAIHNATVGGQTVTYNGTYGNTALSAGNEVTWSSGVAADPLFVSAADFHLQNTSPVINKGVDLGATYDTDKDGNSQDRFGRGWEMGAYVFKQSPSFGIGF